MLGICCYLQRKTTEIFKLSGSTKPESNLAENWNQKCSDDNMSVLADAESNQSLNTIEVERYCQKELKDGEI